MKLPRDKTHLIDTEEVLIEGESYITNCRLQIAHAKLEFRVDIADVEKADVRSTGEICSKCMNLLFESRKQPAWKRYVYGVREGQSARDAETEEAA
ncbi:MAG: hypothetical protein JWQ87_2216 [Candidatus Sulfotelmatobacter sp.]|nr:hypothetical protein [Candidatus Sulfotelmatobacter sp.]